MRRALLLSCLALSAAVLSPAAQEPTPLDVQLFGHRGFTRDAPENSIAALEAAARLGLTGSEIDLRTTRDGHVVLMHDDTLDRTTTGTGRVDAIEKNALHTVRLERPDGGVTLEPVPDLDAVLAFLDRHPGFSLAFDAKDIDITAVGPTIIAAGVQDRVIFFIDDPMDVERARAIKRIDPRLRLSVNLQGWWKIEGLATFTRKALDADALFASEYFIPKFGFDEAKAAGAEVQVFLYGTHDLPARLKRVAALGADVVSADRPDLLVPLVRRRTSAAR